MKRRYAKITGNFELRFLEHCITGVTEPDRKIIEKTVDEIKKVYEGIMQQKFAATPAYTACNWCVHENICPAKGI